MFREFDAANGLHVGVWEPEPDRIPSLTGSL